MQKNRSKNAVVIAARKAADFGHKAVQKARGAAFAVVGATTLAFVGTGNAHAGGGDSLGASMLAKLTGVEGDVQAILVILVGVIALFILYSMIKKAR